MLRCLDRELVRGERDAAVLRTPITLTAAALAGVLMLSACGSVKLGAAAVSDDQRISSATVANEVSNLNQAYQADKAKIQLQFAKSQMPQEVLSWLLRFQVREQMAQRYGVTVTQGQVHLFTALSWTLLAVDGIVGLLILHFRWRKATAAPAVQDR